MLKDEQARAQQPMLSEHKASQRQASKLPARKPAGLCTLSSPQGWSYPLIASPLVRKLKSPTARVVAEVFIIMLYA